MTLVTNYLYSINLPFWTRMRSFQPTLGSILAILMIASSVVPAYALQPLSTPTGKIILNIVGNLSNTNSAFGAQFDRTMLESLPQVTIHTYTPWTEDEAVFEGPLLHTLLESVGSQGSRIDAVALNDYQVTLPISDAVDYPVIVALRMNGKALRVRSKGPLWIIYPWSDHEELKSETYFGRAIWQLVRMNIY